jgi:hypothetical protein
MHLKGMAPNGIETTSLQSHNATSLHSMKVFHVEVINPSCIWLYFSGKKEPYDSYKRKTI